MRVQPAQNEPCLKTRVLLKRWRLIRRLTSPHPPTELIRRWSCHLHLHRGLSASSMAPFTVTDTHPSRRPAPQRQSCHTPPSSRRCQDDWRNLHRHLSCHLSTSLKNHQDLCVQIVENQIANTPAPSFTGY